MIEIILDPQEVAVFGILPVASHLEKQICYFPSNFKKKNRNEVVINFAHKIDVIILKDEKTHSDNNNKTRSTNVSMQPPNKLLSVGAPLDFTPPSCAFVIPEDYHCPWVY